MSMPCCWDSVIRAGDTLMIQADLVSVADGSELWGDQYNRKLRTHQRSGRHFQRDLRKSTPQLTGRKPVNWPSTRPKIPRLIDFTCKVFITGTSGQKADSQGDYYFNQAVERDPNYALAYAGLAEYLQFPG